MILKNLKILATSIHPLVLKLMLILIPGCTIIFFTLSHLVVVASPSIKPRLLWRTGTQGQSSYYVLFDFTHPFIKGKAVLTKRIVCGPGDYLNVKDHSIYCNDTYLGIAKTYSQSGKKLPTFYYEGMIPDGKAFVLGSHPDSFDSRYFGFIDINETEKLIVIF